MKARPKCEVNIENQPWRGQLLFFKKTQILRCYFFLYVVKDFIIISDLIEDNSLWK